MSTDLAGFSLSAAVAGLRQGDFSAVELAQSVIDNVAARDGDIGAFAVFDGEALLRDAAAADEARAAGADGALLGVPIALKDNISVAGESCSCGSHILEGYRAAGDATVVRRLREAGAIMAGRTAMDEFAMGSSEGSVFKTVRNPAASEFVAGGSSGGSAAAVAGGMVPAALGTDTGGSVRAPASFCGCVGLRPSYGRVSRSGTVAMAASLDSVGTLTRSVADAALMLGVLAGKDEFDHTTSDQPVPDYVAALEGASLKGRKIGLPCEYFSPEVDPEIRRLVGAAAERCAALGAEVSETSLPHTEQVLAVYYVCATAEGAAALARMDGIRYGRRAEADNLDELYIRSRSEGFGAEVKRRIIFGTYVLTDEMYQTYYMQALKVRSLIRQDFEQAFAEYDALLTPVTLDLPNRLDKPESDPWERLKSNHLTAAANLAGICGISVPCGSSAAGLPVGVQFMAPALAETRLLQLAHAFETE